MSAQSLRVRGAPTGGGYVRPGLAESQPADHGRPPRTPRARQVQGLRIQDVWAQITAPCARQEVRDAVMPRIHWLRPDLTAACGHTGTDPGTFRRAAVTCGACNIAPAAEWHRQARRDRIEDYIELRSWGESIKSAATRLGVTTRTIERYRQALRQEAAS